MQTESFNKTKKWGTWGWTKLNIKMHWWLGYSPHKPDCHLSYKKWHSGLKKKCRDQVVTIFGVPKTIHIVLIWNVKNNYLTKSIWYKIETGLWFRTLENSLRRTLTTNMIHKKWKSNQIFGFQDTVDLPAEHICYQIQQILCTKK